MGGVDDVHRDLLYPCSLEQAWKLAAEVSIAAGQVNRVAVKGVEALGAGTDVGIS